MILVGRKDIFEHKLDPATPFLTTRLSLLAQIIYYNY